VRGLLSGGVTATVSSQPLSAQLPSIIGNAIGSTIGAAVADAQAQAAAQSAAANAPVVQSLMKQLFPTPGQPAYNPFAPAPTYDLSGIDLSGATNPPAPEELAPSGVTPPGNSSAPSAPTTYIAVRGDSLWSIAAQMAGPGASNSAVNYEKNLLVQDNPTIGNKLQFGQSVNMPQAGEQLTPQGQAQAVAVDAQYQQQLAARQYVASGGWDDPSGPVLDFSWAHDSGGLGNGQSDPWGGFDQYLYARPVIDSRTTQPAPAQILTIADTDPMGDPTGYTIDVAPNTKSDIIGDAWTHPNAMVDGGVKFLGSIGPGLVNSYLNGVQAEANLDIVNAAAISGQPIPELPNQSPVQLQMPTYDHKGEAGGALLTGLGLSVWGALEGITATVPEDIPPAIPLNNALPPNFKVLGLDDIPSSALDVGSLRESLGPFVTSGDTSRISVAAATVTNENGEVTNLLSVSGSSWKGNSPTNVTIN
jgi:LysM repeat protein